MWRYGRPSGRPFTLVDNRNRGVARLVRADLEPDDRRREPPAPALPPMTCLQLLHACVFCWGLALAATSTQANDLARSPAEYLLRMDGNRDGRIGLAEYQDYLSRGFAQMDRDGDGRLSVSELPRGARTRRVPTLESHRRSLAATFDRQDADHSGFLDAREIAAPPR